MSNVDKFFGPPGTGKTTTLLRKIEEHLDQGVAPDKIAFISFSVKAAEEGKHRARRRFGFDKDDLVYFCTSHAFCKRAMGITRVLEGQDIKEFLELYSFPLTQHYHGKTSKSIKQRQKVEPALLEAINKAWAQYREEQGIFSFADMINEFINKGRVPDLEVLIVDEAQDLAELNWRLIEKLMSVVPVSYIAGDDDQAIYEWNGARPDRFIGMEGRTVVLDQSFRVPKEVHRVAERIASRISTRQAKKYLPTSREGKTERLPSVDVLPTKEGEWLILASCDYMLNGDSEGHNIRKRLVDQGVPFSHNGFRYIPQTMIEAVDAWKELKQKKKITVGRLETIYRYLSKTEVKRGFLSAPAKEEDKSKVVKKKEVVDLFGLEKECLNKTWEEVFSKKIKEQKIAFIKKALKNKEDLHSEPRISLSTIHKAKGGEADNVAVLLDLSPAQKLNATLNADSLHRQFYVAVTRARENLFLINAQNETLQYGL
jgi:superfamily I DNA/RNA helicase